MVMLLIIYKATFMNKQKNQFLQKVEIDFLIFIFHVQSNQLD
jgi:hypothetical protein